MLNPDDLRRWCMEQPRPHLVRVHAQDGAVHEVLCAGPWTKVGETLAALQPDQLQAVSADGKVLRAIRPGDESADWSEPVDRARVPTLEAVPITAADPETQRFALVAQLLANAYRHSTDIAFSQLVALVDAQNARAGAVERAQEQLHKAHIRQLEDQLRAAGQEPADGGDLMAQMLGTFIGGMGGARPPEPAPAAAPTTTNGKH